MMSVRERNYQGFREELLEMCQSGIGVAGLLEVLITSGFENIHLLYWLDVKQMLTVSMIGAHKCY